MYHTKIKEDNTIIMTMATISHFSPLTTLKAKSAAIAEEVAVGVGVGFCAGSAVAVGV